jgi:hypothetical protein
MGKQLLERLAEALGKEYGQGFSLRNLGDMRRFYGYFTIRQALPDELSSTKTTDRPSQKRQHVEMPIMHGPHKIQVSEYITKLPSKKVIIFFHVE